MNRIFTVFWLGLKTISTIGFFISLLWLILHAPLPEMPETHPVLLKEVLQGTERGFASFGSEFLVFRKYLPAKGNISFIMDYPFSRYGKTISQLYTAQSFLVPLVLNPDPGEKIAIINCTNQDIAKVRMLLTSYVPAFPVADGKAIAIQKP